MKKRTLEIKADVGDHVSIPALELKDAVVLALYVSCYCMTYEVAYFHNGDRKTAYLHDHEFEVRR